MFDALEIAFKRRRRSLSSGAEANGRRVIGPSFSLPFLGHYILARPPSQAQHLAAQKADLSPVRKAMSRARGPQLGRPQMWYRGETRIGRARSGRSGHLRGARCLDEDANAPPQIVLADVERRDEAHHLIVESAGDEQHVLVERGRDRGLGHRLVVELHGAHRTEAPNLTDPRM